MTDIAHIAAAAQASPRPLPVPSSAWDVALGPIPALGQDNTRILAELGFDDGATVIQEEKR